MSACHKRRYLVTESEDFIIFKIKFFLYLFIIGVKIEIKIEIRLKPTLVTEVPIV